MNNLIYQILKCELLKEEGTSIKNISFIKDCNKLQFCIYLDVLGFDLKLIENQMVELENLNHVWKKQVMEQ